MAAPQVEEPTWATRGALDDRIELRRIAVLGDPQLHADHRTARDAPFEFGERDFQVVRIQVHEAKGAIRKLGDGPQRVVVLFA